MSEVVTASIGSDRPASLIRWHSATSLEVGAKRVERARLDLSDGQPRFGVAVQHALF